MNNYTHSGYDVKVLDGQILRVDKMLTGLIRILQERDEDNQSKKNPSYP